jgi:hypothetical protein
VSVPEVFALLIVSDRGPIFREFCTDLDKAKRRGQELADLEKLPFLIFSFDRGRAIGRLQPKPSPEYCRERAVLERVRDEAEAILNAARNAFHDRRGACLAAEFQALSEELRKAWQRLRSAETALHAHLREHHCLNAS